MAALATQLNGVSVVTKANVYFDGGVVSHTILVPDGERKTLGLIRPGSYHFNTDAAELMREYGAGETVGPTAWNNRLAALVGLGLVIEDVSSGRTKRYRPLLQGV